jgi:hypothetical protein
MPAVAAGAASEGASFYWHLGDFRALYDFDQDMLAARAAAGETRPLAISDYQRTAWDDFIQSQIEPFGATPVYLAIGNHELVQPKSRGEFLAQFADWLNAPPIQSQRLRDNPKDRRLKTYYHWIQNGMDFITLDNATNDQFDAEQVAWLERVLARDASDPSVTTVAAGMHAALPDSLASDHSMSDWAQGEQSGRRVYAALLKAQNAGKRVYILASHSHFYMSGIFGSPYWRAHGLDHRNDRRDPLCAASRRRARQRGEDKHLRVSRGQRRRGRVDPFRVQGNQGGEHPGARRVALHARVRPPVFRRKHPGKPLTTFDLRPSDLPAIQSRHHDRSASFGAWSAACCAICLMRSVSERGPAQQWGFRGP